MDSKKDLFTKLVEKREDLTEKEKGHILGLWEVIKILGKEVK